MKFFDRAGGKTEALLQSQLPKIRELFAAKVGPALIAAAKDEKKFRVVSEMVYTLLPAVIRLAVREEAFVNFCVTQRAKLVPSPVAENTVHAIPLPLEAAPQLSATVQNFFIAKDGEELGEMSLTAIRKMIAAGGLSAEDYYLDVQANEWLPLDHLPDSA